MSVEQLYTIKEVANLLKVHYKTIEKYIRDGKMKAIKFEGNTRISDSEINRFLKIDKAK